MIGWLAFVLVVESVLKTERYFLSLSHGLVRDLGSATTEQRATKSFREGRMDLFLCPT